LQKARENYQTALATFRRLADRVNESATLYALGTLELQENNLDKAAEYLQQSVEITEEMRRVSSRGDLTAAFSNTVYDRYETYIECLMRMHSAHPTQQHDVRAFELSESARGRSLADLLRGTQTNLAPGVEPQLAEREKSLRQSLRVKENYRINLLGKPYKQEELDALNSELARLNAEFKEVGDAIAAHNPSYAEINRPKSWDLRRIQEQVIVDDETVLLEFSLGTNRSYVWVVTRNNFTSRELAPQAEINKAVQEVYGLLGLRPSDETESKLSGAVKTLSSMVLAPVASDLNKRRLIVVADGALNYIPFQILRPQPDKDDPLVAHYEVDGGPSASILGQLRQETSRRKDPSRSLAAFGAPVFASNYAQEVNASSNEQIAALQVSENQAWRRALRDIETDEDKLNSSTIQPLLFTRIELANLRDVAGPDSFVATGFDATREKLAAVDLTQYAILHIATHGILDPKRPERSGLLFTMVNRHGQPQNGFLGLQDVYSLHAPVDLVVLSACRTGLGKDVRGEGLIGLTRGFMYAGAASVVASLWRVDDEATAELMKRFYANMLRQGMTPAAALRAAQNDIRRQPRWSSPYFWAAFTIQGDHRQNIKPVPQRASYAPLLLIGTLGSLLAIAYWLYFRRRA
jgi:CHAT domain-containing protein